jgi:hypothetical protein
MSRTRSARCYECGSADIYKAKAGNYYCGACDTMFYRATGTVPEGWRYYYPQP